MDIRRIIAVTLAVIAVVGQAQATPVASPAILGGTESTRSFQQRTVDAKIAFSLDGETLPGSRSYLRIRIDHAISGDMFGEDAHCGPINGILALALPQGIEFDAEPRLYFVDENSAEQFMYSKPISQKPWLPDLSQSLADASSTEQQRIYHGIAELNQVLDKRVSTVLPADPRLQGRDPNYTIAGKSWIIPCDVLFQDLLNLFEPDLSLVKETSVSLMVPVRFTEEYSGAEVVAYAGFLSAAVARVTILPSEIPPDAIILVEEQEQAPATAEPASADPAAADSGDAAESTSGSEDAGAATPEQPAEPAEPVPVDALIFDFEWVAWESSSNLSPMPEGGPLVEDILTSPGGQQLPAEQPGETPVVRVQPGEGEAVTVGAPAVPQPEITVSEPRDNPPVTIDLSEPATPPANASQAESGESIDVVTDGATRPVPPAVPPAVTDSQPQQPVETAAAEDQQQAGQPPADAPAPPPAEQPAVPAGQSTPQAEPGVVEIEPGTLPVEDEYHVVPLKPITGSAQVGRPATAGGVVIPPGMPGTAPGAPLQAPGLAAGQFVPPADLGEMVLVPEGYFLMGTSNTASAGDADELPQSQVYLPAYYIDKHLVTNRQFYAFVVSSGFKPQGSWDKHYDQGTADMPVRGVTWDDANAYARWAGKRLPSEAEWEKAARGTDGRLYPWGDEWSSEILPRGDLIFNLVHAPGALSPYGCQSMVGVLWQWTSSSYGPYPYNPDVRSEEKVLRGGCYSNGRNIIRCANRYAEPFNVALNTFGFRCARDA